MKDMLVRDRLFWTFLVFAAAVATLYRLAPIVLGEDAMARFFITEDGYLMLTVARNLAIGHGLSVSDGTIATNGVQPLATFLYALPYLATGGDKVASLAGVIALAAIWSVAGLFAVRAFAAEALRPSDDAGVPAMLVAVLWFAGPLALFHTMNALETGLYVLMVALTVTTFGRMMARAPYSLSDRITLGLLCGATFLARIDGAILVTALFLVRFVEVQVSGRLGFFGAVREALLPGAISLALAAPWLIYNHHLFGSIMPISGTAQSASAAFGENAPGVPAKLFETMLPMLPVPGRIEDWPIVQIVCGAAVLLVMAAFLRRTARRADPFRFAIYAYCLFAVAIAAYYGFFFGAAHFLSRYMAPIAPLLIAAAVAVGLDAARSIGPRAVRVAALTGVAAVALSLLLLTRLALPGAKEQGHFQVVEWVEANVPEEIWVGAVQTGTLGYWHDRTINLDGKVNPEALRARLDEGDVLGYVMRSEIAYVVDWFGVGETWSKLTRNGFDRAFALTVADSGRNLSVLARR